MSQSLNLIYVHIVFSTKDRKTYLQDEGLRSELFAYLSTVSRNLDCECYRTGGHHDHIHMAVRMGKSILPIDLISKVKTTSSRWMKTKAPDLHGFSWQRGYGAFSVGPADLDKLIGYIDRQDRHHQHVSFQDEFRAFLNKYGIEYDERYVWD